MFFTYVLYSEKLKKYYLGSTSDLDDRLDRDNSGRSKFTKMGIPWRVITFFEFQTRSEAIRLEKKIKGRGIQRFLEDIKFGV